MIRPRGSSDENPGRRRRELNSVKRRMYRKQESIEFGDLGLRRLTAYVGNLSHVSERVEKEWFPSPPRQKSLHPTPPAMGDTQPRTFKLSPSALFSFPVSLFAFLRVRAFPDICLPRIAAPSLQPPSERWESEIMLRYALSRLFPLSMLKNAKNKSDSGCGRQAG